MHAIQVDHVVKRYKNGVQALNGLSLSVKEGEIFSLLGQNGAGKSTLIRILTTYLCPTAGEIEMMGKDIKKDAAVIRSQIACVAQQTSITLKRASTSDRINIKKSSGDLAQTSHRRPLAFSIETLHQL